MILNAALTEELLQQVAKQYLRALSIVYLPQKNAILSFRMSLKKRGNLSHRRYRHQKLYSSNLGLRNL